MFNMFNRGSVFWLAFSEKVAIRSSAQIDPESMKYFTRLHSALLDRGIYIGPSGFEVGFISAAHSDGDIAKAVQAFKESLDIAFADSE